MHGKSDMHEHDMHVKCMHNNCTTFIGGKTFEYVWLYCKHSCDGLHVYQMAADGCFRMHSYLATLLALLLNMHVCPGGPVAEHECLPHALPVSLLLGSLYA